MAMRGWGICIALALAVVVAGDSQARDIYRWIAEDGTVTYGNSPPRGVSAERLGQDGLSGAADDFEAVATDAQGDGDEPADGTTADTDADSDSVLEQECARVRENLDILENPAVRRVQTEGGETEILTEERRAELITENQGFLDEWCN